VKAGSLNTDLYVVFLVECWSQPFDFSSKPFWWFEPLSREDCGWVNDWPSLIPYEDFQNGCSGEAAIKMGGVVFELMTRPRLLRAFGKAESE
jgi:hypothetical protein